MNDVPAPAWQGRVDLHETGPALRWHQRVKRVHPQARQGLGLIGFAVDAGVSRNGGRAGAAEGPSALRAALGGLPLEQEPDLWDAGDVVCHGDALEAAQDQLADEVAQLLDQGVLPVVMGGGHEVAWGSFQGLMRAQQVPERLLIVNLDAHFDLRQSPVGHSGTPFRQMQEWSVAQGRSFHYHVAGISPYANTPALFERAHQWGVKYHLDEDLQSPSGVDAACEALAQAAAASDAVYLTVCLDVLSASVAPGVSAPSSLGLSLHTVHRVVDAVLASGRVRLFDLAELNPRLDRDAQTARVGARLIARVARSHGRRLAAG